MPKLDLILTEQQTEWLDEIAPVASKKSDPKVDLTPERWLFRQLRNIASTTNGAWRYAERVGKFEYKDPKNSERVLANPSFGDAPKMEWPEVTGDEPAKGATRLFFSETLANGLLHAASMERLQGDVAGKPVKWDGFMGWVDNIVSELIATGKVWADAVEWEDEETETFKPKPASKKE